MSGHTPGPWTLSYSLLCGGGIPDIELLGIDGPDWFNEGRFRTEAAADARLIAAAPELYEALIDTARLLRERTDPREEDAVKVLTKASAALAKVEDKDE